MPEYQAARRIGVYLSMATGEIHTASIVRSALQQGKKVLVPYTYRIPSPVPGQPSSVMDMVSLHSWEDYESLKMNSWGIPTPSDESIAIRDNCLRELMGTHETGEAAEEEGLDMILMPGMAFDRQRQRLGHGKGYYDFFLHRYEKRRRSTHGHDARMPLLGEHQRYFLGYSFSSADMLHLRSWLGSERTSPP